MLLCSFSGLCFIVCRHSPTAGLPPKAALPAACEQVEAVAVTRLSTDHQQLVDHLVACRIHALRNIVVCGRGAVQRRAAEYLSGSGTAQVYEPRSIITSRDGNDGAPVFVRGRNRAPRAVAASSSASPSKGSR